MKYQKTYIFCDDFLKYDFFKRFPDKSDDFGRVYYFTDKFSLTRRYSNIEFILSKQKKINSKQENIINKAIVNSVEYKHQVFSYQRIYTYALSVYPNLLNIIKKADNIFIFNGNRFIHSLLLELSKDYDVRFLFFENSNISNKIICDPVGVNYNSTVVHPYTLDKNYISPLSNKRFNRFLIEYKRKKLMHHNVKQGINSKKINLYYLYDLYKYIKGYPLLIETNIISKLINYILNIFIKIIVPLFYTNIKKYNSYCFFPTQVSNDSQLLRHASYTNLDAIRHIKKIHKNIVIKIHPAERNSFEIIRLLFFSFILKYKITNINTWKIIAESHKVFTINSTVGLESIMCNQPTFFLGKSIFTDINKERLNNYIHGYLINIDMFNKNALTSRESKLIANRLNNNI